MTTTLLYHDRAPYRSRAEAAGGALWLPLDELRAASGWDFRPEGLCRGDLCVPIPSGRKEALVGGRPARVDLAALARFLGQAVVADEAHEVWAFGEAEDSRRRTLDTLEAPDFTLPDLEGRMHSLHDYRGAKIFLVSWASW